jgi:hypothetical protein
MNGPESLVPLRHGFGTLPHLRGKFKREHVVDIPLVSGHDDLAEQTTGDSLAFLKRTLLQVIAQQLPKGVRVINDLLPMPRLFLNPC